MKKLLIIGAGFLQAFVIKKAVELGYYVLAVDSSPFAVGFQFAHEYAAIDIMDTEACLEYARKNSIDGVLTAATDYGVITAAVIANDLHLKGLSPDVATLVKNKYLVRKRLLEANADDTEQAYEVKPETNIKHLLGKIYFPVIVKPCDGSGSRGTSRVNSPDELETACRFAMENSITNRAVIETFIFADEYGAESFVENGKVHILGIMKKKMTLPPYYAELGHMMPSGLSDSVEQKVKACVEKAIKALQIDFGSVNMDLLITQSESVHIVDIGARMGGNLIGSHIIPIGTGIDYMEAMLKAFAGDTPDFETKGNSFPVSTRLLALKPGIVKQLPDFSDIQKKSGVIIEHHLSVGDCITPYRTNLDGCGYIVSVNDKLQLADEIAEKVKTEIDDSIVRECMQS